MKETKQEIQWANQQMPADTNVLFAPMQKT